MARWNALLPESFQHWREPRRRFPGIFNAGALHPASARGVPEAGGCTRTLRKDSGRGVVQSLRGPPSASSGQAGPEAILTLWNGERAIRRPVRCPRMPPGDSERRRGARGRCRKILDPVALHAVPVALHASPDRGIWTLAACSHCEGPSAALRAGCARSNPAAWNRTRIAQAPARDDWWDSGPVSA